MMRDFIIYDALGKILRTGLCAAADFELQAQDEEFILEGTADDATQYVVADTVLDMPPKPSENHVFDYQSKEWVLDLVLAEAKARGKRYYLLTTVVDSVNAIRWNAMTPDKQNEWTEYRQALLDVPQQPGFPADIIWPVAPGA